jgi:hypothetical protein
VQKACQLLTAGGWFCLSCCKLRGSVFFIGLFDIRMFIHLAILADTSGAMTTRTNSARLANGKESVQNDEVVSRLGFIYTILEYGHDILSRNAKRLIESQFS